VRSFVSFTFLTFKAGDGVEDVAVIVVPVVYVGLQFLDCVRKHMLFSFREFYRAVRA
jgi:hypothetical protein